ncbi:MAG TPA: hypothetical protein PKI07_12325, partial [Verrucomicrobiota bacterium]|nr:hypothetical protein [Verrucomicrobiota bacterium]
TDDLVLTKDALYQLSYMGSNQFKSNISSRYQKRQKPHCPAFPFEKGRDTKVFDILRPDN